MQAIGKGVVELCSVNNILLSVESGYKKKRRTDDGATREKERDRDKDLSIYRKRAVE